MSKSARGGYGSGSKKGSFTNPYGTNQQTPSTANRAGFYAGHINLVGNARDTWDQLDPETRAALEYAASEWGGPVIASNAVEPHYAKDANGKRHETPNHSKRHAVDLGLYDENGRLLPNGTNATTAPQYGAFGQIARDVTPGLRIGANWGDNMHYDDRFSGGPGRYAGTYAFAPISPQVQRYMAQAHWNNAEPMDFRAPPSPVFAPAPDRPPARVEGGIYDPLSSIRAPLGTAPISPVFSEPLGKPDRAHPEYDADLYAPGYSAFPQAFTQNPSNFPSLLSSKNFTFGDNSAPPDSFQPSVRSTANDYSNRPIQGDYRAAPSSFSMGSMPSISPDTGGGVGTQGDFRAAPVRDVTNSPAYDPGVPMTSQHTYTPPSFKTVTVPNPEYQGWVEAQQNPATLGTFTGVPSLAGDLTAGTVVPGDWNKAFPTTPAVTKPVFGPAPPKTITKQIPIAAPAVPAAIPTPPPRPPEISQPLSLGQQLSHALGFGGNGGGQLATGGGISGWGATPGGLVAGVNKTEYSRGGAAGNMGGGYRTSNEGGNLHG